MPVASSYPPVDIPNVDLWTFLLERKDRQFPDDKSQHIPFHQASPRLTAVQSFTKMPTPSGSTPSAA